MNVKPKRTFSWYLENRLLYLYSLLLILYLIVNIVIPFFIYGGFNMTISWRWIITSIDFIITYYTLAIYLIGLIILLILKRKTNNVFSKLFLLGLVLIFIWDTLFGMNYMVVGYFKVFVFILFLVIVVTSKSTKQVKL